MWIRTCTCQHRRAHPCHKPGWLEQQELDRRLARHADVVNGVGISVRIDCAPPLKALQYAKFLRSSRFTKGGSDRSVPLPARRRKRRRKRRKSNDGGNVDQDMHLPGLSSPGTPIARLNLPARRSKANASKILQNKPSASESLPGLLNTTASYTTMEMSIGDEVNE